MAKTRRSLGTGVMEAEMEKERNQNKVKKDNLQIEGSMEKKLEKKATSLESIQKEQEVQRDVGTQSDIELELESVDAGRLVMDIEEPVVQQLKGGAVEVNPEVQQETEGIELSVKEIEEIVLANRAQEQSDEMELGVQQVVDKVELGVQQSEIGFGEGKRCEQRGGDERKPSVQEREATVGADKAGDGVASNGQQEVGDAEIDVQEPEITEEELIFYGPHLSHRKRRAIERKKTEKEQKRYELKKRARVVKVSGLSRQHRCKSLDKRVKQKMLMKLFGRKKERPVRQAATREASKERAQQVVHTSEVGEQDQVKEDQQQRKKRAVTIRRAKDWKEPKEVEAHRAKSEKQGEAKEVQQQRKKGAVKRGMSNNMKRPEEVVARKRNEIGKFMKKTREGKEIRVYEEWRRHQRRKSYHKRQQERKREKEQRAAEKKNKNKYKE